MAISGKGFLLSAGRVFFATLAIVATVVGIFYVSFQIADRQARERSQREKAELREVFSAAIADGTVVDPPVPPGSFAITSRHGGNPYTISYTNSAHQKTGYFVSGWDVKGKWNFKEVKEPTASLRTFIRDRSTNR